MNAKAWQDLMLQTVQRIDVTQQEHTAAVAGVSTKCDDMSNRLKNLEKTTHSAPCAEVQTLRMKVCTAIKTTKWFVGMIIVVVTSLVGYWLSRG